MPTTSIVREEEESVIKPIKIYTTNTLGLTPEGRMYLREELLPKLEKLPNVLILNPWDNILKMTERQIEVFNKNMSRAIAVNIGKRNWAMIDESHVIFACLNGTEVDGGTAAEIGYGFRAGKFIMAYRTDLRLSGETTNMVTAVQVESAVNGSSGKIYKTLDGGIKSLQLRLPDLRVREGLV